MKLLYVLIILVASVAPAMSECDSMTDAMSKHQLIIKGMMKMNAEGKLSSENSEAIGKRIKLGEQSQNEGYYVEACSIYESIIEDYGFDESLTQAQEPNGKSEAGDVSGDNQAESQSQAEEGASAQDQ
jgi:hypothetical protein